MRLYIYKDSPSARWGLRPQAPIWVLANFGDKRNSGTGAIWLVVQFGLDVFRLRVPYCVISR
ncbi:hypothetical protein J6590_107871, partial [Homalodisca vitripennis]